MLRRAPFVSSWRCDQGGYIRTLELEFEGAARLIITEVEVQRTPRMPRRITDISAIFKGVMRACQFTCLSHVLLQRTIRCNKSLMVSSHERVARQIWAAMRLFDLPFVLIA